MKYSILYPYYKRPEIISPSLSSLSKWYLDRKDYEVIFILDLKNNSHDRDMFFSELEPFWNKMKIVVIDTDIYTYNSCRCYNVGAAKATGEFLVISNPECIHSSDVFSGFDFVFQEDPNSYIVCACESIKSDGIFIEWYQHSVHNNRRFHFCSAISKFNYDKIDGFDEDYIYGVAYEDKEWRERVYAHGCPFIVRDDLVVSHIDHPRLYLTKERSNVNKVLYNSKRK